MPSILPHPKVCTVFQSMAHLTSAIRVVASARTAAHLGYSVNSLKISPVRSMPKFEAKDDLNESFRHLGISPVEASMSATCIMSPTGSSLVAPLHNTQEYRLPSLVKPMSIILPNLYDGVILEKSLPPNLNIMEKVEPLTDELKEAPSNQVIEKQAAVLIGIRRRKMKKHRLKKLRKRMKFEWQKIRQKREYQKEKLFQATQMAKVREYEAFDAATYVADVLRKIKEKPTPMFWKGKRLPPPVVKQLMEEEELKKKRRQQMCTWSLPGEGFGGQHPRSLV
ncbi:uncharacterized protein [Cherax quadricarinatus]|uniref:uncharacterized protein isoform X3 n=1 Tax=Cherax quadricarinatus TaxID=27406 RepID=UPI00387EBEB2